ncbi:hypothetical protein IKP13_08235 [bacterium]|nr:hypothetical protein [bacterium]
MQRFFIAFSVLLLMFLAGCEVEPKLPENALVLDQVIYVDEVQEGVPQTVQMPNGKVVTYKMPMKLKDKQLIKIREVEGEPPYYIRVFLRERDGKDKK